MILQFDRKKKVGTGFWYVYAAVSMWAFNLVCLMFGLWTWTLRGQSINISLNNWINCKKRWYQQKLLVFWSGWSLAYIWNLSCMPPFHRLVWFSNTIYRMSIFYKEMQDFHNSDSFSWLFLLIYLGFIDETKALFCCIPILLLKTD